MCLPRLLVVVLDGPLLFFSAFVLIDWSDGKEPFSLNVFGYWAALVTAFVTLVAVFVPRSRWQLFSMVCANFVLLAMADVSLHRHGNSPVESAALLIVCLGNSLALFFTLRSSLPDPAD